MYQPAHQESINIHQTNNNKIIKQTNKNHNQFYISKTGGGGKT